MNREYRRGHRFGLDAAHATFWLMLAAGCALNAAWATAVIGAILTGDAAKALIHLLVPPLGIIRGFGIWLGTA